MKKQLLWGDIGILAVIWAICLVGMWAFYMPKHDEDRAPQISILVNGEQIQAVSLDIDRELTVGDTGLTLKIANGKAFVSASDCNDKVCMASGFLSADSPVSKSLVCLPNKVVIRLTDQAHSESEVDAIVG